VLRITFSFCASSSAAASSEFAGCRRAECGAKSAQPGRDGLRGFPDDSNGASRVADAGEHHRECGDRQDDAGRLILPAKAGERIDRIMWLVKGICIGLAAVALGGGCAGHSRQDL
jgi:hypothetical protein